MKKFSKILLFSFFFFSLLGCQKEEFDKYYGRPANLEDPIFQSLEANGNFTNLISVIETAGYKDILSKAGYWTIFAPNDEAFKMFFQENAQINGLSDIDSLVAQKIVKYALVYNAFRTDHIADFQASYGWEPNMAYKRRTAYYDGFKKEVIDGVEMVTIASSRNNDGSGNYYVPSDNNKYIPYFHENFIMAQNLNSTDYNYFFPDEPYTGFNVISGEVVNADIIAENGIIHEVSKVSLPLLSIDQYIADNQEYSLFKSVLDDNLVQYIQDSEATQTYQASTGGSEVAYVKVYDAGLAFSPNNENYLKVMDNDAQSEGYTMFVPQNDAFQGFIDDILLKHYPTLSSLPKYVFVDLANAHMWQNTVWPSKFTANVNFLEEEPRFDKTTNVVDRQVLSNGLFYGTNTVQESNFFYSVYTSAYLDPDYSLMTRALNDADGYRRIISDIGRKFALFMMSDEVLFELGYSYDTARSEWNYTSPETGQTSAGTFAKSRIMRILYNHIASTPNGELDDLSGNGMFRSGDADIPGEYIKFENNQVFAAGNEDLGNVVNITGYEDQSNGRVYYTDNILEFSEEPPAYDIRRLAGRAEGEEEEDMETPFTSFYNFLENASIYDSSTGTIRGIDLGTSYTFLIPNNEAIQQAVEDGVLPGIEAEDGSMQPNYSPDNSDDITKVDQFILYHVLENKTVAPDGLENGLIGTVLNDEFGETVYLLVINDPGSLQFQDSSSRTADIIPSYSNNLADRSLIHLIDNYLLYNE
jgi:uncharacterized surface protein with fasciclin (FAS1) repeats